MAADRSRADFPVVDAALARRLVDAHFPVWSGLELRQVLPGGWDHRTFRLGDELAVRLPSAMGYVPQLEKERHALPRIAAGVGRPVPEIVAVAPTSDLFPAPWSVRRWLRGRPLGHTGEVVAGVGLVRLADELAAFLLELAGVEPDPRFVPGPHSAGRGGPVTQWSDEVASAIGTLTGRIDAAAARRMWDDACAAPFDAPPRWVHGDVAPGNLLVGGGVGGGGGEARLRAVIDFGCAAVGDPACDLAIAWDVFDEASASRFLDALGADEGTRARGAGWALWKALITFDEPVRVATSRRTLARLGVL